jgi:putative SOS response-associated peptidase YedK
MQRYKVKTCFRSDWSGKVIALEYLYIPGEILFLAGCYRQEPGNPLSRFVILTRDAPEEIAEIHHRMPVIIPEKHIERWLSESPDVISEAVTELRFERV